MDRRILVAILILILLILLGWWWFEHSGTSSPSSPSTFPGGGAATYSGGTNEIPSSSGGTGSAPSSGRTFTDQSTNTKPASGTSVSVPYAPSPYSYTAPASYSTYRAPSGGASSGQSGSTQGGSGGLFVFPSSTSGGSSGSGASTTTSSKSPSGSSGDSSGDNGSIHITLDPKNGDIHVGKLQFNMFVDNTPLQSTNNVGDPDNMAFGMFVGMILDGLFPGLGRIVGAAIGSNLFPGYRLSDFNIKIKDGAVIIDGFNPFDPDGKLQQAGAAIPGSGIVPGAPNSSGSGGAGGSGGGSFGGGFGSGGSYFGGKVTSTFTCTCGDETLITIDDYASKSTLNLVYSPGVSRLYDNNNVMNVGGYLIGSYDKGAGDCEYIVGEDCEQKQSDGQMNSQPGTGTS